MKHFRCARRLLLVLGGVCVACEPVAQQRDPAAATVVQASEEVRGETASNASNATTSSPATAVASDSQLLGSNWIRVEAGRCALAMVTLDEKIDFEVVLTRPFEVMTTEVTRSIWESIADDDPQLRAVALGGCSEADCPVAGVSWLQAVKFANVASQAHDLEPCYDFSGCDVDDPDLACNSLPSFDPGCSGFRLPTQAEWECAARAGERATYVCGDDEACLDRIAWTARNSEAPVHPVARLEPNAWGLYDVTGNVAEFVFDGMQVNAQYYRKLTEPLIDPIERPLDMMRMTMGASSSCQAILCSPGGRGLRNAELRSAFIGVRLVRSLGVVTQ